MDKTGQTFRMKAPSFRDYDDPKRKKPYGWDYYESGKRKRPTFKTKKEKDAYRKKFEQRWTGDRDAVVSFDAEKWREFLDLEKQAGSMLALRLAVEHAKGIDLSATCPTFSELAQRRIDYMKRQGLTDIRRAEQTTDRFILFAGDKQASFYTKEDVESFCDELREKHKMGFYGLFNYLKYIKACFNLAVEEGHLKQSPAHRVNFKKPRGERRTELLTPEQVKSLLLTLWKTDKPLAGVFAILFFTGLRMSMIAPQKPKRERGEFIRSDMIDVKGKAIVIPPGIMKSNSELIIDEELAPANLWPWLEEIHKAKLPKQSNSFNVRRAELCKAHGFNWPANAHRRTCASYYAALHGKDMASELLGNTAEMIAAHYKVSSFRKVAADYFAILPPSSSTRHRTKL
jgi:integrase